MTPDAAAPTDHAQEAGSARQPADPQAVLTPLTSAAIFLVLVVPPGSEQAVREVLGDVNDLRKSVGFRVPEAGLTWCPRRSAPPCGTGCSPGRDPPICIRSSS